MTEFKWSPEAIAAARGPFADADRTGDIVMDSLNAAVKAQPVVALPSCPMCGGERAVRGENGAVHASPCPSCNGYGVEQRIPVSVVVEWLETRQVGTARIADFHRWVDEWKNS